MTEEEVIEVYNYLHKNFDYHDGNLIKKDGEIITGSLNGNAKKLLFNVSLRVNGKKFNWSYGHLVYIYHHKIKPDYIMMINGNPADHRIENLRSVDHSKMMQACDLRVKNKHGYKGVVQDNKRFGARLWTGKTYKYISWHSTAEEAHEAYLKAKNEHHSKV